VLERADGLDRARRAAQHPLGLDPDCVHLAAAGVNRDHRRLGQDDPAAAHVYERVGRAEIDRHVAAPEAGYVREETHGCRAFQAATTATPRPRRSLRDRTTRPGRPGRRECNERIYGNLVVVRGVAGITRMAAPAASAPDPAPAAGARRPAGR